MEWMNPSSSIMPELVVTDRGNLADLDNADEYESPSGECLYITYRTRTCLLLTSVGNEGEYYRELSDDDAAIWLVENGLEVPGELLEGFEIL